MPAALDVNWEAIQALAIQVGVREAARRMGISEEAVKKRCTREGWIENLPRNVSLPPTVLRHVPNVPNGANLIAEAMRNDSIETRAAVLRVGKRAIQRVERCDDDELMQPEVAEVLHKHTKTAALAGSWANQAPVAKLSLTMVGAGEPLTLDAELVQDAQPVEDDPLAGF